MSWQARGGPSQAALTLGSEACRGSACSVAAPAGPLSPLCTQTTLRLLGAQAEIGNPDAERPDCGRLVCGVECSPVASPAFRVGGGFCLVGEGAAAALARASNPCVPACRCCFCPLGNQNATCRPDCTAQGRGGDELSGELARALERSLYAGPSGRRQSLVVQRVTVPPVKPRLAFSQAARAALTSARAR